jgi:hypothetical protein
MTRTRRALITLSVLALTTMGSQVGAFSSAGLAGHSVMVTTAGPTGGNGGSGAAHCCPTD